MMESAKFVDSENDAKPQVTTDEVATIAKDIDIFAGWLKRLENPDPVLRTEAAGKGLKLYDEVDRDAHAGSVLQQRCLAVVGKEWEIIPAKSATLKGTSRKSGRPAANSQEQVVADFVSEVLENCNFDQARQEILRAILYGYYAVEALWQATADTLKGTSGITIKKLIAKHPRRFIFTPERELRLLTLQNMIEGEQLPDRKFIVFTYGDSDNPYGRGLGQKLWWPVWFKKNGVKFWLVFLEKFGMPTVKGKYPPGTDPTQQQALMDAIEAIQSDTGIKIPDSMDIEFLEASRAGTVTHEQLCDYMDRQISKAVLGQTLTTEIKGEGSYAASQTHNDVRQEIIEADADLLDSCLNETLIRWIVDYNFPGVAIYPKIKTYTAAKPDLTAQSQIDKTLVVDIGLPVGKSYFYETYGIPEPAEGEELVSPAPKAQPFGMPQFAEDAIQQDAADLIADRTAQAAMTATDEIYMAPLKRLVDEAKDMDDLRDRILDLWGKMNTETLGVIMAQGMMLAEMTGRYEVASEAETRGGGKKKA
jgi:phage gp29-like protein